MNRKGNRTNLKPFLPGQSGNPGGRPVGSRNRIQADFLHALAEDFEKHGPAAITACREREPYGYLRVIGALMPKEHEIVKPFAELTTDQLDDLIASHLRDIESLEGPSFQMASRLPPRGDSAGADATSDEIGAGRGHETH